MNLENYFKPFREGVIGIDHQLKTPYHDAIKIMYADWTASGRNYRAIENKLINDLMPYVANTHTETSSTGLMMTYAYHKAQAEIKKHVNGNENDVLISTCAGMTGVVNKFQRILGLKIHELYKNKVSYANESEKPVVFITHMEHHSNQTSWLETLADVVIIPPAEDGTVCPKAFKSLIEKYKNRTVKIAAITSCSNVTGIQTPYMDIAAITHQHNGLCFVDFACSAPYVTINMHENDENGRYLDAVYFSPHKFLGGPGSSGVLIFNKSLYKNNVPDHPGGGTVDWTNPWGGHKYVDSIEAREDGGTPPFLQTIKVAMAMRLKDEMGVEKIQAREEELMEIVWDKLDQIPNLKVLANQHRNRLGIVSFYIEGLHYNLGVKLLNDRFGIQTRGGCSCAGTYGHYLLNVDEETSNAITSEISKGNCTSKPGWIRMSIHPTHTNEEVIFLMNAITELAKNFKTWSADYHINLSAGIITHKNDEVCKAMKQYVDDCLTKDFLVERKREEVMH